MRPDVLLTNEEISEAIKKAFTKEPDAYAISKTQLAKVVKWLEERNQADDEDDPMEKQLVLYCEDWQALRDEAVRE